MSKSKNCRARRPRATSCSCSCSYSCSCSIRFIGSGDLHLTRSYSPRARGEGVEAPDVAFRVGLGNLSPCNIAASIHQTCSSLEYHSNHSRRRRHVLRQLFSGQRLCRGSSSSGTHRVNGPSLSAHDPRRGGSKCGHAHFLRRNQRLFGAEIGPLPPCAPVAASVARFAPAPETRVRCCRQDTGVRPR